MFDEGKLWKERFGQTSKELSRYLRYIFNGHLVIVFMFLLGTGAYYYQDYVKSLTPDFPAAIVMAVVLAFLLSYSPIYTFLLEADRIFLLPLENKLTGYFRKSILVSFILQVYLILLVLALLMPMYVQVEQASFKSFFLFFFVISIVKGWNLLVRWQIQYYVEKSVYTIDSLVRYFINGLFLYFLFTDETVFMAAMAVIMCFLLFYFRKQNTDKGLKWEQLIDLEERRMTSFYRIANLFTDVPKLKDRVKRRKWLDWIFTAIPFKQENSFFHLYVRTFFRAGDYFGLVIRLTLIGAGALYLISFGIGQVLLVILFLYLTGFQLLPLWNHHQNKLWVSLYPLKDEVREKSFYRLLLTALIFESLMFALVLAAKGEMVISAAALICAIAFSFYFTLFYSKKRLQVK